MAVVLVTGGTGTLGRELVPRLAAAGYTPRIMSRRAAQQNIDGDVEWARADLATGEGLAEAVAGAEIVIHAASDPFGKTIETDVEGTRRLLETGKAAGVANFYYISIVGVDRITYSYYTHKLEAEKVIEDAGAPYTILRATQFHPLLDTFLSTLMRRGPFLIVPGSMKYQLIDVGEVADHMVATLASGPSSRLPDIGGPKVQTASEIARAWLKATRRRLIRVPVPAMGPLGGFAKGYNCCPENAIGTITWEQWLEKKYGPS
jgi:uncharacterized protein YbjT (DUF2867 family)